MTLAALLATMGLSRSANASLSLIWLDGPDAGSSVESTGGGALSWRLTNYDTGTLYNFQPVGTKIGYGQGGASPNQAAGIAALDNPSVIFRPTLNAMANEDGWGLVKVNQIDAVDPTDHQTHQVFNSLVSPYELTGIFHGEKDFYLNQVTSGTGGAFSGQIIDGSGLQFDIYSDPAKNFNYTAGPGGRGGLAAYATATDGTLQLSLQSTPGFINHPGNLGGTDTEFESNTGLVGYTALNIVGGSPTTVHDFDTNSVGFGGTYGSGFVPGDVTPSADVWFQFTTSPGTSGWDVTSSDPGTFVVVPEPASAAGLIGCLVPLFGAGVCRFRTRKARA